MFVFQDAVIVPYLHGCHYDPDHWKKPFDLYPEHFLDENGRCDTSNIAYMPFSTGKKFSIFNI